MTRLWGRPREQPGEGIAGGMQRDGAVVDAPATGHAAATVPNGRKQRGVELGAVKHLSAMDGHLEGWFAEVITAGSHKPQLLNVEVGAKAGNAADVEGACRLHQHHHHIVHSVDVNGGRSKGNARWNWQR